MSKFPKYKGIPLLGSSENPENLSLTIKGVLLAIVPIILAIGQVKGWSVTEGDLSSFIESVTGVLSGVIICYGLARKFLNENQ